MANILESAEKIYHCNAASNGCEGEVARPDCGVEDYKKRYTLIVNSMVEGFAILGITSDDNGRFVGFKVLDINPACENLFNLKKGSGDKNFKKPLEEIVRVVGEEKLCRIAFTDDCVSTIDCYFDYLNCWLRIKICQAVPGQLALFFTNISEQKKAEERLLECLNTDNEIQLKSREEVRRLSQFPKENPHPVLRCDITGTPLYLNEPAQQWLVSLGSSTSGPIPEALYEVIRKSASSNTVINTEITNSSGCTYGVSAIRPEGESYVNLYCIDLTERKKVQETLERSNRELELFVHVASHDLQEPLRAIVGFLQLLEKRLIGKVDEKGKHYIDRSIKAGYRLQTLIRDLLAFSRVHTKGSLFQQTDLNDVVEKALHNLRNAIQEKDAEIRCVTLPSLRVDAKQIRLLFENLIANALQYNESKRPSIEIYFQEMDSMYLFYVRDNGIGISPRFKERIFIIFQRLHTEEEYSGTGLGLALCRKIVERHGGNICVKENPAGGSIFQFTLPKDRYDNHGKI